MKIIDRITSNPKSTLEGLFTGMLQAAFLSAANYYMTSGNTTNWQPYAAAGAVGAVSALVGALKKDPTVSPTPYPPAPVVDPIVAAAVNRAMADMVTKQFSEKAQVAPAPSPEILTGP